MSFSYIYDDDDDDCHLQADMVYQLIKQEDIHNEDSTELETVSQCLQLLSFVFHVAYRFISTRFLCVDSIFLFSTRVVTCVERYELVCQLRISRTQTISKLKEKKQQQNT